MQASTLTPSDSIVKSEREFKATDHAPKLASLKERIIAIWDKVQPPLGALHPKYDKIRALDNPLLDAKKYNPYQLTSPQYQGLLIILSALIQIADDIKPAFSESKPSEWQPLESRDKATVFLIQIIGLNTVINYTRELHVELMPLDFMGESRAIAIMNGLLTQFVEGFEIVEGAGNVVVQKFCELLIPADDKHACVDASTRMALSFAKSGNFLTDTFSEIIQKAATVYDNNGNPIAYRTYFGTLVILLKSYWGKYFKEDTGEHAVCSYEELKKHSAKTLGHEIYPLIQHGIKTILSEEPEADFIFLHAKLEPEKKFDFIRMVLKEPQCIASLVIDSKEKQEAFDELMLTRKKDTFKNMLGFVAQDCQADEKTLSILVDNLSKKNLEKAVTQAGITWKGSIGKIIVTRLKKETLKSLADVSLSNDLLDGTLGGLAKWLEKATKSSSQFKTDLIFSNTIRYISSVDNDDDFSAVIDVLSRHLTPFELLEIIHYADIIRHCIKTENNAGKNKIQKLLPFLNRKITNPKEAALFDKLMNIYSEERNSNLFGVLIYDHKQPVQNLINKMSSPAIVGAVKKANILFSDQDLVFILDKLSAAQIKDMLSTSNQLIQLIDNEKNRQYFIKNLGVIAKKISAPDLLAIIKCHNVFGIMGNSDDEFSFIITELHKYVPAGTLLQFLQETNNFFRGHVFYKDSFQKHFPILIKEFAEQKELTPLQQVAYDRLLSTELKEVSTTLLELAEISCDQWVSKNPHIIHCMSPKELLDTVQRSKVCWGSKVLEAILDRLEPKQRKDFLSQKNQLVNHSKDLSYFSINLIVIAKKLEPADLLEVLLQHQRIIQKLANKDFAAFMEALNTSLPAGVALEFIQVLNLPSFIDTEEEADGHVKKIQALLPILLKFASEQKSTPEQQRAYDDFLATPLKKMNTNMLGFLEHHGKGIISKNPILIKKMSVDSLKIAFNPSNLFWGATALKVILDRINDSNLIISMLSESDFVALRERDFSHFLHNLKVIYEKIGLSSLVLILNIWRINLEEDALENEKAELINSIMGKGFMDRLTRGENLEEFKSPQLLPQLPLSSVSQPLQTPLLLSEQACAKPTCYSTGTAVSGIVGVGSSGLAIFWYCNGTLLGFIFNPVGILLLSTVAIIAFGVSLYSYGLFNREKRKEHPQVVDTARPTSVPPPSLS